MIATKVRWPMGEGPNDVGLSRKHILASAEASLRRLGTDTIDLYQVHGWDGYTPLEETLGTLDTLVQAGKVRYLGASNYMAWQLQKAVDISRCRNWEPFACLQPLYNLLDRQIEWDLVEVCANEGLGIIPWSPLRGGWLSGKYRRGMAAPPENTRVDAAEKGGWGESWTAYNTDRTWNILDELFSVAGELGKTPGAGRAQLGQGSSRRHRADRWRADDGAARRQPRLRGLAAQRDAGRPAEPGQRAAAADLSARDGGGVGEAAVAIALFDARHDVGYHVESNPHSR